MPVHVEARGMISDSKRIRYFTALRALRSRTMLAGFQVGRVTDRCTSEFDSLNRLRTRTTPATMTIAFAQGANCRGRVLQEPDRGRFTYPWEDAKRCRVAVSAQDARTSWGEHGVVRKFASKGHHAQQ